jgi:hypothetical protein
MVRFQKKGVRKMEQKRMRKEWVLLQVLFVLAIICQANALPVDVNIYSSTTIEDGDEYGTVNIYDTLPDQTIVDMTGGDISYCNVYDTANLNYGGGEISLVSTYNNSSAIANVDVSTGFCLYDESKVYLYELGSSSSIFIYDDSELHIYGYNLEYEETALPNWVTGQWENGQSFQIYLRNITSYDPTQVFLHEVPEPLTLFFLVSGSLILRKKHI